MALAEVKRQFIDTRHGQLHLRVAGHATLKPALLCLHMMPKSSRGFAKLMPALAEHRLVIAPDYPGYGESDPFREIPAPEIPDYAEAISDVIAHFQLSYCDIVGYHTGAMVAVYLADKYPRLVRRLINISAPLFTPAEVAEFKQYFAPVPLDEAGTRFKTMWQRVLKYRGPGMTLEMAAASMAENLRGGERYEDGHYAAFNFSSRYAELIEQIEQPLLVMNLNDDLHQHSKRVVKYLNNGKLQEYPEWGHGCLELWPDEVAAEMLKFLDQ